MHRISSWIPWLSCLALISAGCSGSSGGTGAFYVETCSLGCSNGQGGSQVSCGVVNAAENQDLAMLFSGPVSLSSVTKQSFKIFDVTSSAVPAGSFLIDALNPNRVIFRPKLSFDENGNPVFGFKENASYKILIAGTQQGDDPPYIESTSGRDNEARVLCTITTSGVVDPIPGSPSVEIQVVHLNASGDPEVVTLTEGQVPGSTNNVLSDSDITFSFDELMNIGTLVVPATGQSPYIQIGLDTDGNLNTIVDRSPILGTYSFSVDIPNQTTTLVFDPTDGFPSAGANPSQPRLVVIDIPSAVSDIAGTSLGNAGLYNFAPQVIVFPESTLPAGGEDFASEDNRDPRRSGADWGTAIAGRLTPGEGGGSGRLGDLRVQSGEDRRLITSPTAATGTATYSVVPSEDDTLEVAGEIFTFKLFPSLPTDVQIQTGNLPWTIGTLVDALNAFAASNPGSGVAQCLFVQATANSVLITAVAPGSAGNSLTMSVSPPGAAVLSGATLSGGGDGESFPSTNAITNFDFAAQPGVVPPDLVVDDGVFEFAFVDVEPNSSLEFLGDNSARVLVRGDMDLQALGTLSVVGEARPAHASLSPYGQPGGVAGPAGGRGGDGGDRNDTPDTGLQSVGGVTVADSVLDGSNALGIGALPPDPVTPTGNGRGGLVWPLTFPTVALGSNPAGFGDLAFDPYPTCVSHQVAGSGSGGTYATGGVRGVARTDVASGTNFSLAEVCNLRPGGAPPCPPFLVTAVTGIHASLLEPPSLNPTAQRLLTPALGYLRGGAGGGGGGCSLFGSIGQGLSNCFDISLSLLSDNSAAAGGGGGGAVQIQVGDDATLAGVIDARGGQGGGADTTPVNGPNAAPGGGGSGGAILVEAGALELAATPGRLAVPGGSGGAGPVNSLGGAGGNGIVRVEQRGSAPSQTAVAASVEPTDPGDPLSTQWLSVGTWSYSSSPSTTTLEEGFSGAQSCWLRVPDDAFSLSYKTDPANAAPEDMGWNMDVILDLGNPGDPQAYPFRGDDGLGPYAGLYPEEAWGQLLNSELLPGEDPAPIVVRFQGAKAVAQLPDLCNVDLTNPVGGVQSGSLTPWVPATTDLNSFYPLSDMVRFVILFDRTAPFASQIEGVTNLRIEVQPE